MSSTRTPGRDRLSRDRVLAAAVEVADEGGVAGLTIRSLAERLGVKPMALYHYVASKDEIVDGIVDLVFGEIELPTPGGDWREQLRRRATSSREVLRRHSWATVLLQSRVNPGPSTLRHHDAFIATLRDAGFSMPLTAHAFALVDAYVYGFVVSEAALPIHGPEPVADLAASMVEEFFGPDDFPHLRQFTIEHVMAPGYDFGAEFDFGLDLVLDGLALALRRGNGDR